jgi:hypothetical protein
MVSRRFAVILPLSLALISAAGVPAQQPDPPRTNQDTLPPRTTQKPPMHGTH